MRKLSAFILMLAILISSAYALTSAGLPVVLEWKNHTMVSGLHNLTVVVSNNFTCSNQIVANQTFIGGIVNGRSNVTLRNLTVDYNTNYYVCKYLDGVAVGGSPMNTTLGQGYIQLRDLNVSGLNNAVAPVWGNVSGKPADLINSTFANNTYIFKVNESFLNVNSSVWWANISGFQYRWFITLNNQLFLNETTLNSTVDTRIDLKLSPVQTNLTEINTTLANRITTAEGNINGIRNNLTEVNNTLNTRVTTLENRPVSNVSASGVATKLALFNNATHLVASDISEDSTQVNFSKNVYVRNNLTVNGTFIASIDATNITSGTVSILRLPNLNNSHFHDAKNLTGVLQVANGGTGLSTFPALRLLWTSATDVINTTSLSSMLSVSNGILFVENATSTQKIDVFRNNTFIGSSENLNFIAGQNITINVTYDSGLGQNNVTIGSFGGGGGTADGVGGNATAGGIADRLARFTNSTHLSWTNITVNSTSFIARLLNYQFYFGGDSSPSIDIKQSGVDNYFLIDSHFEVDDAADVVFTANSTEISGFNNQFRINSTGVITKGNISCGQIIGGSDGDYCADATGAGGDATAVNKSNYVYGVASNLKVTNANPDVSTKYLLHFEGVNASTVFSDSSLYMQGVVPSGATAVTNDTQKFGSVGHFDGTANSYLSLNSVGDWEWGNFGTKNFTFDFWLNFKQLPADSTGQYIWTYYQVAVEERSITVTNQSGVYTLRYKNADDSWTGNLTGLTSGTWHHYAIVRNATSLNLFFDGGMVGSRAITTNSPLRTATPQIGTYNSGSYLFNGYMDEFRFSLGSARWNSNFTSPASEYYGYPQYKLNISADVINLYDGENATTIKNMAVLPDVNVTGVNGLDAGYEANSVWYYAWVINNGTTTAGLLSTSSTSPTMPAGYSFKKLVSAVYNNAGGNFSGFQHIDGDYTYLYPVKIINDGGSTTTTAIDLSTTVPKRELTKGVFGKMLTNAAFTLNMNPVQFRNNIASDNSITEFAIYNGFAGPPGPSQWIIHSLIEEQTIYYQLDANTLDMWVSGFTTRS